MLIAAANSVPIGLAMTAAALAALVGAFLLLRRRQLLVDTPTSQCAGVFMGWNEVRGRAYSDHPTTSHFTQLPCVRWAYTVEEEVRETRTESSTDAQGHMTSHQVTSYVWRDIEGNQDDCGPFFVVDDSGSVLVDARDARVQDRETVDRILGERRHGLFVGDGPTGRTREREHVIAVGDPLFVTGTARLRDDAVAPIIDQPGDGPFVVSTRGESGAAARYAIGGPLLLVVAGALAVFGGGIANATPSGRPGTGGLIAGGAAYLVALTVAATGLRYNGLVRLRNRADRAFSLIEVMLQRRHELIPQLVACVQAAATFEQSTQTKLAELRANPANAQEATNAAGAQTAALRDVFAVAEANPTLHADASFLHLQHAVADTEDRVAAAREFYNDSVTALHNRTHTFPGVLLARFGEFGDRELFAASGLERTTTPVQFEFKTT